MAKKDMRNALAKARDEFFKTEEGVTLCQGTTSGDYLRNRLETAFIAGWDLCVVAQSKHKSLESEPEPTEFPVEEVRNRTIKNYGKRNDEQLTVASNLLDACDEIDRLEAENKRLAELAKELIAANPDCCWRKCWNCGKVQIHRSDITPGVLCRFCGSQDTRLMKAETKVLKGESDGRENR